MDFFTWMKVNGPLSGISLMLNAFYIFCMLFPLHRERIKQPLRLILSTIIFSTYMYHLSNVALCFSGDTFSKTFEVSFVISMLSLSTSLYNVAWLNFYYYIQIVPAQRALNSWVKKNIKSVIFTIWIGERIYTVIDFLLVLVGTITFDTTGINGTLEKSDDARRFFMYLESTKIVLIARSHFCVYAVIMTLSNGATVLYLYRHLRRMWKSRSIPCPMFRRQLRVAITGSIQGVLFVCCCIWISATFCLFFLKPELVDPFTNFLIINLYILGSTFLLGVGQTAFRNRAVDIWSRGLQWWKLPED